jgi:hypothetical protein
VRKKAPATQDAYDGDVEKETPGAPPRPGGASSSSSSSSSSSGYAAEGSNSDEVLTQPEILTAMEMEEEEPSMPQKYCPNMSLQ